MDARLRNKICPGMCQRLYLGDISQCTINNSLPSKDDQMEKLRGMSD